MNENNKVDQSGADEFDAALWLRNNYHLYNNVGGICDALSIQLRNAKGRIALQAQPSAPANMPASDAASDLRKLFVELTNTPEVSESGAVVGHIIFNEQLDRLEKLVAAPQQPVAASEPTDKQIIETAMRFGFLSDPVLEKDFRSGWENARKRIVNFSRCILASQPSVQPIEQKPVAWGDWVELVGGECPVPPQTRVQVKRKDRVAPYDISETSAGNINWANPTLIAYRVSTPQPSPTDSAVRDARYALKLNHSWMMNHGPAAYRAKKSDLYGINVKAIAALESTPAVQAAPADVAAVRDAALEDDSDKYINELVQKYGYGHPLSIAARLEQWISRHGGQDAGTLVMYEAMRALKSSAPAAQPQAEQAGENV